MPSKNFKIKKSRINKNLFLGFLLVSFGLSFFSLLPSPAYSQSESELRKRIEDKNKEIETLEKEIKKYQADILEVGKKANTLQNTLQSLELSRKKLTTDINLTQKKIDSVILTIESLGKEISDTEVDIKVQKEALAKNIRETADADQTSLLEAILIYESLGDFWREQLDREKIQEAIDVKTTELSSLKDNLSTTKDETEEKRRELERLRLQLSDQRKIVDANRAETDKLLKETKNQESGYKKILADRQKQREAFAQEILQYESQLRLLVDPGSFPKAGSGVLASPVDVFFLTQEFGDTAFSRSNPQAYNGRGHNGIDLRASPGTPIKAALAGVVSHVGDTDAVCPGASYGKWVLIKHANGLSTLYAHLSLIKVGNGQNVGTRELIGYSGSTGYATGPHLHFALFASQGVQVSTLKSRVCSGTYTIPLADLKAYLNPMSYF